MQMGNLFLHNIENAIRSQGKFYYLLRAEGKKANPSFRIEHYQQDFQSYVPEQCLQLFAPITFAGPASQHDPSAPAN
jgi:hypothetical protein